MEFEYIKLGDLQDTLEDIKALPAPLDKETQQEVDIWERRCETWESVKAVAPDYNLVVSGVPHHIGGFFDGTNKKKYLNAWVLDNRNLALHVIHHENNHERNGILELALEGNPDSGQKRLDPADISVLETYLPTIRKIDLVEGFNERATFKQRGVNEMSGYKNIEVPAAELLETLTMEKVGVSLQEAFNKGDKTLFFYRLRKLTRRLLAVSAFEKVANEDRMKDQFLKFGLSFNDYAIAVKEKFENLPVDFGNVEQAYKDMEIIALDVFQEELLQKLIPEGANLQAVNDTVRLVWGDSHKELLEKLLPKGTKLDIANEVTRLAS